MSDADKSPEQLREEIEQTREELGDTVEALGHKTDVKGRTQAKVADVRESASERAQDVKAKVAGATPESATQGGQQAVAAAREHPLPLIVGAALAAGFLLGRWTA